MDIFNYMSYNIDYLVASAVCGIYAEPMDGSMIAAFAGLGSGLLTVTLAMWHALDKRLDRLDDRIGGVDGRVGGNGERLARIEGALAARGVLPAEPEPAEPLTSST